MDLKKNTYNIPMAEAIDSRMIAVLTDHMGFFVRGGRVRPKGFFLFRPKPKLAETAIFLFGQNRYWNRKEFFVSAETDTETETMISLKSAISVAQWVAQKRKKIIFRQKMEEEKLISCGFYKLLDIFSSSLDVFHAEIMQSRGIR